MLLRWILIALLATLAAFQSVRVALVRDDPDGLASRLWPNHPRVLVRKIMAQVGASAVRQQPLPRATLQSLDEVARLVPLAPEPYLIKGALAQLAGKGSDAERFFMTARALDPRSEAARYFLAETYLRSGRTEAALAEMTVLSRLIRGASAQFAPALASFARTPGAVPQLRRFLKRSPEFKPVVFQELARDARNVDLIMALSSGGSAAAPDGQPAAWQSTLLSALVAAGQYGKAQAVWSRLTGTRPAAGIYNPEFHADPAPPPFNWSLPNSGGVIELGPEGVQVMYFGRQDAKLAEQLLTLPPGAYQLALSVTRGAGDRKGVA